MEARDTIYLSVVIPVFDESAALKPLLIELMRELPGRIQTGFEVIVVDDASTDWIGEIVKDIVGPITLVRHATRLGSGAARKTGAMMARGDLCAWIDGDGTYRVDDLLGLVACIGQFDQVIGVRDGERGGYRFARITVKWLARILAALLWNRRIPDLNSGLRVFRRESMLKWLHLVPSGFSCTTTATLAALNFGQSVSFCPIVYLPRPGGSHSKFHPITDTFKLFRTIFRLRFYCGSDVANGKRAPG